MIASKTALISLLPLVIQSTLGAFTIPSSPLSMDTDMSTAFSFNGQTSQSNFERVVAYYKSDPRIGSATINECKETYWVSYPWPLGWMSHWDTRFRTNAFYRYGCFLHILRENPDPERHWECSHPDLLTCLPRRTAFWTTMDLVSPVRFIVPIKSFMVAIFWNIDVVDYFKFGTAVTNFLEDRANIPIRMNDFEVLAYSMIVLPFTKRRNPGSYASMIYYIVTGAIQVTQVDQGQLKAYLTESVSDISRYSKRQQSSTVSSTTQIMISYCNLTAISSDAATNQNILVGCLGGVARWCNTGSLNLGAPDGCHDYYARAYGNSMYAPIGKTCPMWIKGPNSLDCNTAVKSVCLSKGDASPECGFSKFSQSYLFPNRTLAPW